MPRRKEPAAVEPCEPVLPLREPPADIPALPDKGKRIEWIVGLMREMAWPVFPASLPFRQRLAEAWGVSESTIRDYSAEAHRQVEIDPTERTQAAVGVALDLDAIARDALSRLNAMTGMPDYASAIKAIESKAKFLGIEPATKVEHSGQVSLESVDDIRKRLEAAKAKK